jgi:membrane-associated PAP2 superfamily phosphatase
MDGVSATFYLPPKPFNMWHLYAPVLGVLRHLLASIGAHPSLTWFIRHTNTTGDWQSLSVKRREDNLLVRMMNVVSHPLLFGMAV